MVVVRSAFGAWASAAGVVVPSRSTRAHAAQSKPIAAQGTRAVRPATETAPALVAMGAHRPQHPGVVIVLARAELRFPTASAVHRQGSRPGKRHITMRCKAFAESRIAGGSRPSGSTAPAGNTTTRSFTEPATGPARSPAGPGTERSGRCCASPSAARRGAAAVDRDDDCSPKGRRRSPTAPPKEVCSRTVR